jgi:hypothetical protein
MAIKSNIINSSELSARFNNNPGSQFFSKELEASDSKEKFVHIFAQYIDFNECFAPAVLNLASRVAASKEFHDFNFFPPIASDRGAEIAAHIFFAAIDEYSRIPHRTLAQHTLVTTCNYFGLDHQVIKDLTKRTTYVHDIRGSIKKTYGFNETESSYERMLFNIGAHVAAEGTAASEFKGLEQYITNKQPGLSLVLDTSLHHGLSAFHWIKIHTIVEEKHFQRAVDAANLAITYRPSGWTEDKAAKIVFSGLDCLQDLQEDFLQKAASK